MVKQQSEILAHQGVTQAQWSSPTLPTQNSLLIPWLPMLSSHSCSSLGQCPSPCSCTEALLVPAQLSQTSQSSAPKPQCQPAPPSTLQSPDAHTSESHTLLPKTPQLLKTPASSAGIVKNSWAKNGAFLQTSIFTLVWNYCCIPAAVENKT